MFIIQYYTAYSNGPSVVGGTQTREDAVQYLTNLAEELLNDGYKSAKVTSVGLDAVDHDGYGERYEIEEIIDLLVTG